MPQNGFLWKGLFALGVFLLANVGLSHKTFWNGGSAPAARAYVITPDPVTSFYIGHLGANEADFYRLDLPPEVPVIFALLASQACPDFLPELWLVGRTLPESDPVPFRLPKGFRALRATGVWQPYRDYLVSARLGPRVRVRLSESGYYLVVYAGKAGGAYIGIQLGQHGFGGTDAGFRAVADFHRCQSLSAAKPRLK